MHSQNSSSNKFSYDEQLKAATLQSLNTSNFTAPWIREVSVGSWPASRPGRPTTGSCCFVDFLQSETCWHSPTGTEPVVSTNTTQQCIQYRTGHSIYVTSSCSVSCAHVRVKTRVLPTQGTLLLLRV
jgi:hypothetical protein